MGSLNGDVVVMRNGRTTSQVSVYNYPEHLNPFYEDDQHKRLRFWKISKKDNEGRRNSFSIGNLKDMWAFKSFRMKKKSSTLGINKTSESPPLLRRDYALDNGWNTFDHRLRASNTPSINGDSFQRNAIYRSSLQTLPTSNDRIGLNRNDGYRSTIQVPRSSPHYQLQQKQQQQLKQTMGVSQNRRYVYGGSVTPQPLRNSRPDIGRGQYEYDSDSAMIRGSSQSSTVSTNPFESDEDDENADINSIGMRSAINGSTTTLTSRTPRKKRRAPAPPTPTHCRSNGTPLPTIRIEPSHDNTQDELRIKEDMDIANLTAEIESFVKIKNNDDVEVIQKDDVQTSATTRNSLGNKENVVVRKAEVERKSEETTAAPNDICNTKFITKEDISNAVKKSNGQVKTEIVTVTTTTKTVTDAGKPAEKEIKLTKVANEIETKIDESKEIKTNGAIPKKPINDTDEQQASTMVTDLCIKETHTEELPQKPVPLKRQTKTEAEVGHVECIHVHVESPKATPRKDHPNSLSSFKSLETVEYTEKITTKTPFVLTSPPTPRRNRQQRENGEPVTKEIVKIVGTTTENKRINELNIKEERINIKPEISAKPTLSPKPVTKESNVKIHGFAEIHKPTRRNNQHAQVERDPRDGSISPPFVPQHKTKEEEEKIINVVNFEANGTDAEKTETVKSTQLETVDNLKITESNSNCDIKPIEEEENKKEIKQITASGGFKSITNQKREDEYDFLYRPKPASQMEWKRSTLAPLETNIPPEKRKSVKDIIESINRSQRLLNAAANKDFTVLQNQNATINNTDTGPTTITRHSSLTNNNNNFNEKGDLQSCINGDHLVGATNSPSPSPSICNNECTDEAHELDNNEIFQKCKVNKEVYDYRETSPITSNLDWNPVPKPKRTKAAHE